MTFVMFKTTVQFYLDFFVKCVVLVGNQGYRFDIQYCIFDTF